MTEQTVEHCEAAGPGRGRVSRGCPLAPRDVGATPPPRGARRHLLVGPHLQQAPLKLGASLGGCGGGPTAPPGGRVPGLHRHSSLLCGLQPHGQQGPLYHVQARAPDSDQPPAPAPG